MSTPGSFQSQPQGSLANSGNDADEDGVSVRPMRLKVLYTFDDQNKTNCLARGSDVLQIKTVAMDETATIGIIELKTCIELVVQSSPELVARMGQDYTIYAYDYSEYDTPLVGQGMLSRSLVSPPHASDTPTQQNLKLITGRVCKNTLGIFNNGIKETLEVKLRLVSVLTPVQGDYATQMEKYRDMNRANGLEPNEWAAFLQSNPGLGQMAGSMVGQNQKPPSRSGSMNMEVVNQLLSPSLSQPQADPFNQANIDSGNESRGGKGAKGKNSSRPSSRASVKRPRKPRQPKAKAAGGNTSGYEEGTDGDDGPAPKKRAKTTKADWNSKSSFGPVSDSLRVTASTAGSLRMFRPIAIATSTRSHLQEMPRAPTPVPHMTQGRGGPINRRGSSISQAYTPRLSPSPQLESTVRQEDEIRSSIESAGPSPEHRSPAETTPEIGSSPPVLRTASPSQSSPPCPSSPILPQMRRNETDSGFMSGNLDDLFGDDDEEMRPVDDEDIVTVSKYSKRDAPPSKNQGFHIQQEQPGPVELLPTRMLYNPPPRIQQKSVWRPATSRAGSVMSEDGQQSLPHLSNGGHPMSYHPDPKTFTQQDRMVQTRGESQCTDTPTMDLSEPQSTLHQNAYQPALPQDSSLQVMPSAPSVGPQSRPSSRMMVRTASMGSLTLPTIPVSDPARPLSTLQRSQTWSEVPHPVSDASMTYMPGMQGSFPPDSAVSAEVSRAQALEAKKAAMRQKLENAIANGVMPPFCINCGAIETPTWRKAWSQDVMGAPPYYEYSDEPGRVTMVSILSRDEQGNPTSYQLIKKFLLKEESTAAFNEVILCNPCGIWLSKYKQHRPEEKWECNKSKKPAEKKKTFQRPAKSKKPKNNGNPTSEANHPQSDSYYPQSEAYNPHSEAPGQTDEALQTQESERRKSVDARQAKRLHPMTSDAASAALRRALKSSPARWTGTVHSPIDIDEEEELGSTRRLLFPSPRKDASPKVLGEVIANVVTAATEFRSPKEAAMIIPNKENRPPPLNGEECDVDILKLFEEEIARPSTPTGQSPGKNLFKTPTRPTPNHRPITRSVSKSIRSIRSARSPGQLLLFQKTPSKTPTSAARRRSPRHYPDHYQSPFTAAMNQIMSDAKEQTSPSRGMQLDFSNLPDLPLDGTANLNFSLEDFFSTDVPMPSSPPAMNFNLYEDPLTMSNIEWSEFDTAVLDNGDENEIKQEPGSDDEAEES